MLFTSVPASCTGHTHTRPGSICQPGYAPTVGLAQCLRQAPATAWRQGSSWKPRHTRDCGSPPTWHSGAHMIATVVRTAARHNVSTPSIGVLIPASCPSKVAVHTMHPEDRADLTTPRPNNNSALTSGMTITEMDDTARGPTSAERRARRLGHIDNASCDSASLGIRCRPCQSGKPPTTT